ncbi:hypothetical protein RHMOL_Rhmol05G0235000 [Rhododendron molle]|uniref:Uncharacterized protein n=1 Tax=Rhododendron molle TaxID=49168 RepID=A0ACC0NTC3_RHOML|nr:hypothetical protein RHMOL_Rhmol05G0235000 [Rhododendron molle]
MNFSKSSPRHQALSPVTWSTGGSRRRQVAAAAGGVRCMAVGAASEAETKKRSKFEIQTLTGWLLKQEQKGVIDNFRLTEKKKGL